MSAAPSRLARLRERLDALEVDALLVTAPANRRWLSGFTGSA
ncbi:MAG: aminopeptidase P family protein, partial [Chloroflexi bacterium]|nr:aminopeptidase P family protein [Chloroflexota bacterium]